MTRTEVRAEIERRVQGIAAMSALAVITLKTPRPRRGLCRAFDWLADLGAVEAFDAGVQPQTWLFDVCGRLTDQVCAALPEDQRTLVAIADLLQFPKAN